MSRSLKTDIPGVDHRITPEQVSEQGWPGVFPDWEGRLIVEIGYCRGEFMMALAAEHPEDAFVGIERSRARSLKMARRLAKSKLENIRLLNEYAEAVFPQLFQLASIDTVWINFPDPWPKDRHARRRLIQPAFVSELAARLKPEGVLHFATDDERYAEQADRVFGDEPLLENVHAPYPWLPEVEGRTRTAYEEQWRAEGRSLFFFGYARTAAASR